MPTDYTHLSEAELVRLAKTEAPAFGALYDQSYQRVLNYVLKRYQHLALAQDLTSETFYNFPVAILYMSSGLSIYDGTNYLWRKES